MKRFIILVLMLLSVNIVAATMTISPSPVDFKEVDWDDDATETITITNTGAALTGITLSSNVNSSFDLSFDKNNFNLTAGNSTNVVVTITQKDKPKEGSGNKTPGNITIINDQGDSNGVIMYITAPQRFEINNVDVKVAGSTDSNLDNDTKIDIKAKPGDEIQFDIKLENLFHKDDNKYEIEDTSIIITIKDINDGDDIKVKSGEFIINAGEIKTTTLTFNVPDIVVSDEYNVIIEVEAENGENGDDYIIIWQLELDVEKRKHDLEITKYELMPAVLPCGTLQTMINIELLNRGDKKESDVIIEIRNSDLNINKRVTGIRLGKDYDDSAKHKEDISIIIDQEFATKGIYPITINAYADDGSGYSKNIDMEIEECAEIIEVSPELVVAPEKIEETIIEENATPIQVESLPETKLNVEAPVVKINSQGLTDSPYFIPIIGLVVIIGGIIIAGLVVSLKK